MHYRMLLLLSILAFTSCSEKPENLPPNEPPSFEQQKIALDATISMQLQVLEANFPQPWGKALGDVDNDGDTDILVQGQQNGELVYYEAPSGDRHVIGPPATYTTDLAVGDLNGDQYLDVVSLGQSQIWWFAGNANPEGGVWAQQTIANTTWHDVEIGDFNGDGRDDVVTRDQGAFGGGGGDEISIWYQPTDANWGAVTPQTIALPLEGEGLIVADLDNDGDDDIVVTSYWFENTGSGLQIHQYAPASWSEPDAIIEVGDLDGDDRLDIILTPSELAGQTYKLSWFQAPPDRTQLWTEFVVDPSTETVLHSAAVGDINLDGTLDIVTAEMSQSSGDDEVRVYTNPGSTLLTGDPWDVTVLDVNGSHSLKTVDFNLDGRMDIVGANWAANGRDTDVKLWINNSQLSLANWRFIEVDNDKAFQSLFFFSADLTGDGRKDLIAGDTIYVNPGADLTSPWATQPLGLPARNVVHPFDANGDGDLDFLATEANGSAPNSNFAFVQNNNGVPVTFDITAAGTGDFIQGATSADFDGDGELEIAVSWHVGNNVELLQVPTNETSLSWPISVISTQSQNEELNQGDLDGDGDQDIFQGTRILLNDGTANFTSYGVSAIVDTPDRNHLADMDGDGDLDAVVGFEGTSTNVVWLENPRPSSAVTSTWATHLIAGNIGGGYSLDVADADKDGDFDVLLGEHQGQTRLLLFENLGNDTWGTIVIHPGGPGFDHHDGSQFTDIDGDGDLDIISGGWFNPGYVWLWENLAVNTSTSNQPPIVSAGPDDFIVDPQDTISLDGDINDDGNPQPPSLVVQWSQVSGPSATIISPDLEDTDVVLSAVGTYIFQLEVSDGELVSTDTVTVERQAAPDPGGSSPDSLLAHWRLDGDGLDSSGSGHDGTVAGTSTVSGQVDSALLFNGNSDYVSIPSFDVTGDQLTISTWIRKDQNIAAYYDERIIAKSTSTASAEHYWMLSTIKVGSDLRTRVRLRTNGSVLTLVDSTNLQLGTWYHLGFTYDGSQVCIWIDGSASDCAATSGDVGQGNVPVNIGRNPDGYGVWPGALDDVRIYEAALTASEMGIVMAGGNPFPPIPDPDAGAPAADAGVSDAGGPSSGTDAGVDSGVDSGPVDPPLLPPTAGFSFTTELHFDCSTLSSDIDGVISACDWDFGDGANASGFQVSHTYAPGVYDVVLTVTDDDLLTDQHVIQVTIQ